MFQPKQQLTLFHMGQMAFAAGRQLIVDEMRGNHAIYHEPRKRKKYIVDLTSSDFIVFDSHDIPFCTQYDEYAAHRSTGFVMDAKWHWVGDPDVIRDYILHKNLNPNFNPTHHQMLVLFQGNETPFLVRREVAKAS